MWLITWKLHFLEWKKCSFVLKFSPQITETCILGLWNFKIFWGRTRPDPLPPPYKKGTDSALFIQSVTLFKPAGYLNFYWNPFTLNTNKAKLINKLIVKLLDRILRRINFFFCLLDLFILDFFLKKAGEKRRVHSNKCLFWMIFSTFLQNIFPFL